MDFDSEGQPRLAITQVTPNPCVARPFLVPHVGDPVKDAHADAVNCMDELANFKAAPPHLKQREVDLMTAADVVFAGGTSVYQARNDKHDNVHQFNSGVDIEHLRRALNTDSPIPGDIADLPHPILLH